MKELEKRVWSRIVKPENKGKIDSYIVGYQDGCHAGVAMVLDLMAKRRPDGPYHVLLARGAVSARMVSSFNVEWT